jgi:CYTH domain-containing protein
MAKEIERKFLLLSTEYQQLGTPVRYIQGYIGIEPGRTIRVRIAGEKAYLTIKGATKGIKRSEFEYEIPIVDARQMLEELCIKPLISKLRYKILFDGLLWEVDEFDGANEGLVVAEVELPFEDYPYNKPGWVGAEVTYDHRYGNGSLVMKPYKSW